MSTDDRTHADLASFHEGDEAALERLIAENLEWVHGQVRGRLGQRLRQRADSIDFVQDSIVQFLKYGPKVRVETRSRFRALMCCIVENTIRDKNDWFAARRRSISQEQGISNDGVLVVGERASSDQRPENRAHQSEMQDWLRLALELMDPDERKVVVLRQWDGLEYAEIAEKLGISAEAARKRFDRAMPKLAGKIDQLRRGEIDAT